MPKPAVVAALLVSCCLAACSHSSNEAASTGTLAYTDFENLDGWLADSPALATLNREKAHSGVYSTMVSAGHDYGLGYSNTLSRLASDWPAKLTVSAWVFMPNDQAAAKLVTEIKSGATNSTGLLWEGLDLAQAAKVTNKWQYVEQTITVPEAAKPDSRILVYLWRADSKQPVYLDDLKISLAK